MAGIAKTSGIPSQVVDRIAAKDTGVDGVAMADANDRLLTERSPNGVNIPTVYDTVHHAVVDIANRDWLNHLTESS